jgi:Rrf2 family protein
MRITEGVEWAVHACVLLAPLSPGTGLSRVALAEFHGVPAPYLAKQMQKLSAAGIVATSKGRGGGYRLARPAAEISLLDIFEAIEGKSHSFRCTEIRQNGPCPTPKTLCRQPCGIAQAFFEAEAQFKKALGGVTVGQMLASTAELVSDTRAGALADWYDAKTRPVL